MNPPRLIFIDSAGTDWRIYEFACADVPAARGRQCLVFESDAVIRRVWNYPTNWKDLSSTELTALSWNT